MTRVSADGRIFERCNGCGACEERERGVRGEKGEGGMERWEGLKGVGWIVRVGFGVRWCIVGFGWLVSSCCGRDMVGYA